MTSLERKEYNRNYRQKNRSRLLEDKKQWYQKNKNNPGYKERNYASGIRFKYSISVEEVNRMLEKQSNRCAICEREFTTRKTTHIDHCHLTGKVRGILCEGCNVGIGCFEDDVKKLKKAINYLSILDGV